MGADGGVPRLLIVEDHPLLAQTVALAIQSEGMAVEVVHPSADHEVVQAASKHRPDVVLLDLDLGEEVSPGPVFVPALTEMGAAVLVVTGTDDQVLIAEALEAGAIGYVTKSQPFTDLIASVRTALEGEPLMAPHERLALLDELWAAKAEEARRLEAFHRLTPRESEVLGRLMDGVQVEAIAEESTVSVATVRSQVRSILMKLGVSSQLAAVALAHRAGWVPPSS